MHRFTQCFNVWSCVTNINNDRMYVLAQSYTFGITRKGRACYCMWAELAANNLQTSDHKTEIYSVGMHRPVARMRTWLVWRRWHQVHSASSGFETGVNRMKYLIFFVFMADELLYWMSFAILHRLLSWVFVCETSEPSEHAGRYQNSQRII